MLLTEGLPKFVDILKPLSEKIRDHFVTIQNYGK
jgi:hypothetical protein